ncbi:MAG: ribonuclease III [Deltaproteobacteria bacterium]|jgi:ribonuclease-3|nr:ribonuclease III [Deltaproteobacteria bacterium]
MPRLFPPIAYTFKNERLLEAALTHCSCCCQGEPQRNGEKGELDNQRLEFLGDAVLDLVVSDYLFALRPHLSEGAMSRVRACLVCESKLATIARDISLGRFLTLSDPEESSGGREKTSLLADAMEALLGAVFLDGGHEATREIFMRLWAPYLGCAKEGQPDINDYKTALQEFTQRNGLGLPVYTLCNTRGPAHQPVFSMSVKVGDFVPRTAMAHSKKEAAQQAARELLKDLEDEAAKALAPCDGKDGGKAREPRAKEPRAKGH